MKRPPCGKTLAGTQKTTYNQAMAVSEKVKSLVDRYSELSDDERHEFVTLVAPIDESEVSEEWSKELHSRADDIDSGRVQLIDGEDFLRRLRAI
jgi:hypothetical protein